MASLYILLSFFSAGALVPHSARHALFLWLWLQDHRLILRHDSAEPFWLYERAEHRRCRCLPITKSGKGFSVAYVVLCDATNPEDNAGDIVEKGRLFILRASTRPVFLSHFSACSAAYFYCLGSTRHNMARSCILYHHATSREPQSGGQNEPLCIALGSRLMKLEGYYKTIMSVCCELFLHILSFVMSQRLNGTLLTCMQKVL